MQDSTIRRYFNISLALYPWLFCYATGISGVSIGDACLIITLFLSLVASSGRIEQFSYKPNQWHICFICYCFLAVILVDFCGTDISYSLVLKRFIKYGLYILAIYLYLWLLDRKNFFTVV